MKLGEGLEWSLHCCTVLGSLPPGVALPASRLAEFHDVPPAYLAKQLQAMSRAGIVETTPGRRGGYRLARPAGEVSLLRGEPEAAAAWFRACVATGLDADPGEFWEPMSEYDLAEWRLERLDSSR